MGLAGHARRGSRAQWSEEGTSAYQAKGSGSICSRRQFTQDSFLDCLDGCGICPLFRICRVFLLLLFFIPSYIFTLVPKANTRTDRQIKPGGAVFASCHTQVLGAPQSILVRMLERSAGLVPLDVVANRRQPVQTCSPSVAPGSQTLLVQTALLVGYHPSTPSLASLCGGHVTHGPLAHPCHVESWASGLLAPAPPGVPSSAPLFISGQVDERSGAKGEAGEVGPGRSVRVGDEEGAGPVTEDPKDPVSAPGASFGADGEVRGGLSTDGRPLLGRWLQEPRPPLPGRFRNGRLLPPFGPQLTVPSFEETFLFQGVKFVLPWAPSVT